MTIAIIKPETFKFCVLDKTLVYYMVGMTAYEVRFVYIQE